MLRGLQLHAATLHLTVLPHSLVVEVEEAGAGLVVEQEGGSTLVLGPQTLTLPRTLTTLYPINIPYLDMCPLPRDTIGHPTFHHL